MSSGPSWLCGESGLNVLKTVLVAAGNRSQFMHPRERERSPVDSLINRAVDQNPSQPLRANSAAAIEYPALGIMSLPKIRLRDRSCIKTSCLRQRWKIMYVFAASEP